MALKRSASPIDPLQLTSPGAVCSPAACTRLSAAAGLPRVSARPISRRLRPRRREPVRFRAHAGALASFGSSPAIAPPVSRWESVCATARGHSALSCAATCSRAAPPAVNRRCCSAASCPALPLPLALRLRAALGGALVGSVAPASPHSVTQYVLVVGVGLRVAVEIPSTVSFFVRAHVDGLAFPIVPHLVLDGNRKQPVRAFPVTLAVCRWRKFHDGLGETAKLMNAELNASL